jgi:hypothetical protein
MSNIYNVSDVDKTRMDESITDVTGKSELVEIKEADPVDKAGWIANRISKILLRLIYVDLILQM